jgi:hypothetical protein
MASEPFVNGRPRNIISVRSSFRLIDSKPLPNTLAPVADTDLPAPSLVLPTVLMLGIVEAESMLLGVADAKLLVPSFVDAALTAAAAVAAEALRRAPVLLRLMDPRLARVHAPRTLPL